MYPHQAMVVLGLSRMTVTFLQGAYVWNLAVQAA